eukprot:scaffold134683_cov23-Tisochrysis_lutea.AAC.2
MHERMCPAALMQSPLPKQPGPAQRCAHEYEHALHLRVRSPTPAKSAAEAIEGALEAGTSTFLHSME